MAEQKPVMERGEMRKLLAKSKTEPVNCALGVTPDQQHALLVMDKIKQPRAMEKVLLKEVPDAKNTRWGTAFVDVELNPKLARFRINRGLPGIARKLVKVLKGTGFSKVEIVQDDEQGTVLESAGEEEEAEAPVGAPVAAPEAEAPPAADFGALTQRLIAAAGRIKQAEPAKVATLAALAGKAKGALDAKDAATAAQVLDAIEAALGQGADPAAAAAASPAAAALQKVGTAWTGIAARIQADLAKLEASIVADFPNQKDAISAAFKAKTAPLVDTLTGPLATALQQAATSTDPAVMAQLKSGLEQAQALLASSTIVADLDTNPFMTMGVGQMMGTAMGAIERAVH